jgi:hypothetical protein
VTPKPTGGVCIDHAGFSGKPAAISQHLKETSAPLIRPLPEKARILRERAGY